MIAIINVAMHPAPSGPHPYEVRVNRELITTFVHNREDGLAMCLRRAADACDEAQAEEFREMISHTRECK
jgi:hypothetical protein